MEHAVLGCLQADSSGTATFHSEAHGALYPAETIASSVGSEDAANAETSSSPHHARHLSPARLAKVAKRGAGGVHAVRGTDLRQARVLMQALCEMRVELGKHEESWTPAMLESRQTATMALWTNRDRTLFTQSDVERGIEARLDAGFRHARGGSAQEAAAEFKRAYLLLCCALTHARDEARRRAASGNARS